jgi:hypothetical protein
MRRFSLQHPKVRRFHGQLIFSHLTKKYGILTPRFFFVKVIFNGDAKGIMALEEHFSKELLESQSRRESVIIKFDESPLWKDKAGARSLFYTFKNAVVDTYGSKKLSKNEKLKSDFQIASGLMRGFVEGTLQASQVFDARLIGRFLAITDMWGTDHGVSWNNMRFYYNPITAHLEPITFDSNPGLVKKNMEQWSLIKEFPARMMADPAIAREYYDLLKDIVQQFREGGLLKEIQDLESRHLNILGQEYFFLERLQVDGLVWRAECLLGVNECSAADRYPVLVNAHTIQGSKGLNLEVSSITPYDVDLVAIEWANKSTGIAAPFKAVEGVNFPVMVPGAPFNTLPERIVLPIVNDPRKKGYQLKLTAEIRGSGSQRSIYAEEYHPVLHHNPIPVSTLEEQLAQHPFLVQDEQKFQLRIRPGVWDVEGSMILPRGWSLKISAGTTLRFQKDAGILGLGPLIFEGTAKAPVILSGTSGKNGPGTWKGLLLMESKAASHWSHVIVKNTTGMKFGEWLLTGGITFYKSTIRLEHCAFEDNQTEDALNIVQSKFHLKEIRITGTLSDGFDADFSDGVVDGGVFEDIGKMGGGDAIDISGSVVEVRNARFRNISDKALSVGEKSVMTASGIHADHVGTGAVSKDGSQLNISDSTMTGITNAGLMAYIKKPEFGPAKIEAKGIQFAEATIPARAQKGSAIFLDGREIETEDVDVNSMYKTIMKPGLRK